MFRGAKVVWRSGEDIRELLIRYYTERHSIPGEATGNWKMVRCQKNRRGAGKSGRQAWRAILAARIGFPTTSYVGKNGGRSRGVGQPPRGLSFHAEKGAGGRLEPADLRDYREVAVGHGSGNLHCNLVKTGVPRGNCGAHHRGRYIADGHGYGTGQVGHRIRRWQYPRRHRWIGRTEAGAP